MSGTSGGDLGYMGFGPARVLDYATEALGTGYDLVIDAQAGAQAEASVAATREGGRVVCLMSPSEAALALAETRGIACVRMMVKPDGEGLRALAAFVAKGVLRVSVARRFALAEAGVAHDYLATRPVGKIVLQL